MKQGDLLVALPKRQDFIQSGNMGGSSPRKTVGREIPQPIIGIQGLEYALN